MMKTWFSILVVACVACGGARRTPNKNPSGDSGGTFCTTDDQCPNPTTQMCDNGVCVDRQNPGTCSTHADCFGRFCNILTARCVDCLNDDHCPPGDRCQSDGTCGTTSGCTTDDDCGGLHCLVSSGACVPCLENAHCPTDQVCRDNSCHTQGGADPTCTSQSDCDPHRLVCNTTSGECEPCEIVDQITGASNCGVGLKCQNGYCVEESTGTGDGTCMTMAECNGQSCFLGYCMPCMLDEMCMDLLGGGAAKICQAETGNCVDPECTTAVDCPEGQGCYGAGHCGECLESTECREGEVCIEGVCGDCTDPDQCLPGEDCVEGVCTPPPANSVEFGELCTATEDCVAGLICLPGITGAICTRTCVSSGGGGDGDCPTGFACLSFAGTGYDGVLLCQAAEQLDSGVPGQPFTMAPGASCAEGNECQTMVCQDDDTCARMCVAHRDCEEDEVCRYEASADPEVISGERFCAATDSGREPVGATCTFHDDCDSGLCMGACASTGYECDGFWDCLEDCVLTCREPCRSDADCEEGSEVCGLWPSYVSMGALSGFAPVCRPEFNGSSADGAVCQFDDECASEHCVAGLCTVTNACALTEDCEVADTTCQVVVETDDTGAPTGAGAYCLDSN